METPVTDPTGTMVLVTSHRAADALIANGFAAVVVSPEEYEQAKREQVEELDRLKREQELSLMLAESLASGPLPGNRRERRRRAKLGRR